MHVQPKAYSFFGFREPKGPRDQGTKRAEDQGQRTMKPQDKRIKEPKNHTQQKTKTKARKLHKSCFREQVPDAGRDRGISKAGS